MDGEAIFGALLDGFNRVAAAPTAAAVALAAAARTAAAAATGVFAPPPPPLPGPTYVRLAYWLIQENIHLGDKTQRKISANSLVNKIESVLKAGHDVDVILWYPNFKDRPFLREQAEEHDPLAERIRAVALEARRTTAGAGHARVYKERYEGWTGSSQHQKIAIFSIHGQRTAIVGGMNLAERYFDTRAHDCHLKGRELPWHDTAVELQGPISEDIEAEWMRRWNRVVAIAEDRLTLNNLSNHLISSRPGGPRGSALRHNDAMAEENEKQQIHFPDAVAPLLAGTFCGVPAVVRLTRDDTKIRTREIRDELLARIGAATTRIYMENNQFTDPELVRAIYNRQRQVPLLQVLIVTGPQGAAVDYLTRRAWLHMALRHPSANSLTYRSRNAAGAVTGIRRISKSSPTDEPWAVEDHYKDESPGSSTWLKDDCIRIKKSDTRRHLTSTKIKRFHDIVDVECDFYFLTPVRQTGYSRNDLREVVPALRSIVVHSKLAVIDDCLICGSANWTYRSMQYDGEMTVFMEKKSLADHVLDSVLTHFNPQDWVLHGTTPLDPKNEHVAQIDLQNAQRIARFNASYLDATCSRLRDKHELAAAKKNQVFLVPLDYMTDRPALRNLSLWSHDNSPGNWSANPLTTVRQLASNLPNWRWW